jgi:hypothetical protein
MGASKRQCASTDGRRCPCVTEHPHSSHRLLRTVASGQWRWPKHEHPARAGHHGQNCHLLRPFAAGCLSRRVWSTTSTSRFCTRGVVAIRLPARCFRNRLRPLLVRRAPHCYRPALPPASVKKAYTLHITYHYQPSGRRARKLRSVSGAVEVSAERQLGGNAAWRPREEGAFEVDDGFFLPLGREPLLREQRASCRG